MRGKSRPSSCRYFVGRATVPKHVFTRPVTIYAGNHLPPARLPAPSACQHPACLRRQYVTIPAAPPSPTTKFAVTPSDHLPAPRLHLQERRPSLRQHHPTGCRTGGSRNVTVDQDRNRLCPLFFVGIMRPQSWSTRTRSPHGRSWIWKCARSRFHCVRS